MVKVTAKIEDVINMLLTQNEELLEIVEQQQKRIHNIEVAVMAHHKFKTDSAGYCVERSDADKMMENFFDASAMLGAFAEVEFKTAE